MPRYDRTCKKLNDHPAGSGKQRCKPFANHSPVTDSLMQCVFLSCIQSTQTLPNYKVSGYIIIYAGNHMLFHRKIKQQPQKSQHSVGSRSWLLKLTHAVTCTRCTRARLYNRWIKHQSTWDKWKLYSLVYTNLKQVLNMTTINWLHLSQNFRTNSTNYSNRHVARPDITHSPISYLPGWHNQNPTMWLKKGEGRLLSEFCVSIVAHTLQAHSNKPPLNYVTDQT